MLPRWFNEWNARNPVNIFGPGIVVGVIGGAVFAGAMLVTFGQPFATKSMQTGPRGTGMSVPEFVSEVETADPTIAAFLAGDFANQEEVPELSEAAMNNIPPSLEGISPERWARLATAMRSWTGIPDLFEDEDNYQTQIAYQMTAMTQSINENWGGHVYAAGPIGVVCYTCHRGQAVPNNIWFRIAPVVETMEGWGAVQNRATSISQSTSLPSDALEEYLLNYAQISVHDLESHVAEYPSEGIQTWQHTERTFSFMNYFSNSLGVNCVFCHNTRAFYDIDQHTPQWNTAMLGISMAQEINNDWLVPLESLYPPERLGPVYADAPKAACKTCHQGYQRPLQGTYVIEDWPELALVEPIFE